MPAHPTTKFRDPWLKPQGVELVSLANAIASDIENGLKGRRRKDAIERRRMVIMNIIANLATLVLAPGNAQGHCLAVSTSKTKPTRYDRRDFPINLLAVALEALEEQGVVTRYGYRFKQQSTTIEPTPSFIEQLRSCIKLADIGRDEGEETIRLAARTGHIAWSGERSRKSLVLYRDTPESRLYRSEMELINRSLNQADITFGGQQQAPVCLHRWFLLRQPNDSAVFNLGGRLYGGFWMNLPSNERHKIRLDGEEIADLDYSSMFADLAYIRAGESLPSGDLYAVPGLENHRGGAKLALLSLLSRSTNMKRITPELKGLLPEGWTAKHLQEAVNTRHLKIAHLFGTDIGVELMFTESRILVRLLLKLAALGIPALSMHDGVMVPKGSIEDVSNAMQEASMEIVGVAIPVIQKPIDKRLT